MSNHTCNKCDSVSAGEYQFDRLYAPVDCLLGKRSSKVWIVGLNPATEPGEKDTATRDDLENYFESDKPLHSYFKNFRNVSTQIYDGFGVEGGTACTEIVKCGSKSFPSGKAGAQLVHNCAGYLKQQITDFKPQLVICNGSPVSNYVQTEFPRNEKDSRNTKTSYWVDVDGVEICIVLTGFIGRIDNYSRRRLGVEIESRIAEATKIAEFS